MDDIPAFSTTSPVSTPVSPRSPHFFLHHNKASEVRGGGCQAPSLAFNNNNNNLGSTAHHPCISLSSNPSPVLKSRTVGSSLSFNRGTMNKPAITNNGSSMARAASFQSRLNPNGYSMLTGPGSDNDSLHSSTSSLEYSGGSGGALTLTKMGSYSSPTLPGEYPETQPQLTQQRSERSAVLGRNPNLTKFSSYGSVFHSEMDQGPGITQGLSEPRGMNHGSMSSLDLQIRDGGGGMVGMHRGGGMMSPQLRYASVNAHWNGRLHDAIYSREEDYCGPKKHCQQQGLQILKAPQPKAKEIPRLNKFPLDLDSLVSIPSTTCSIKAQGGSTSPKPQPRSTGYNQHHTSPPSTSASPSASLSSLDSSSDTPPISLHHPFLPFSPCSPILSQVSIPVPQLSCSPMPFSAAQSPQLEIPGPQIVQVISKQPGPSSHSSHRAIQSFEDDVGDAKDSVGSILQRIASFSQHVVTDTIPTRVTQPPTVQSNGGLSSTFECSAKTTTRWKQGMKKHEGKVVFMCLKCLLLLLFIFFFSVRD